MKISFVYLRLIMSIRFSKNKANLEISRHDNRVCKAKLKCEFVFFLE